jgi:DNA-binding NtrC family response regulator
MFCVVGALPNLPQSPAAVFATVEEALQDILARPVSCLFTTPELVAGLMAGLRDNRLSIPVAVVGPAQPALGTKAIRLGAVEYLTAPVDARLFQALLSRLAPTNPTGGPIAGDSKTQNLLQQASRFAGSSATVLLRGESGTGKEVLAHYIHTNSPRADKPFVAVNCAAIPENLLESELFGHTKGAFSGALTERKGKFQQAHGGTLLLDEISEMDLGLQAKLLRAIQEKVVDPIGSETPVPVDIRLIATTNRQLENYVAEGKFREDLYFRLSVVMLDIPPLRERPGDIQPLAEFFVTKYAAANGYPKAPALAPQALDKLQNCYWKGNVRELENTIHRALLLAGPQATALDADTIMLSPMSLKHMSVPENNENARASAVQYVTGVVSAAAQAYAAAGNPNAQAPTFVPRRLAEVEKETLLTTLAYTQGNRQYAADLLGISLTILSEKLASAGLV